MPASASTVGHSTSAPLPRPAVFFAPSVASRPPDAPLDEGDEAVTLLAATHEEVEEGDVVCLVVPIGRLGMDKQAWLRRLQALNLSAPSTSALGTFDVDDLDLSHEAVHVATLARSAAQQGRSGQETGG